MEDDLVDIYAWPKLETSDLERRRDDYRLLALESRAMSERMLGCCAKRVSKTLGASRGHLRRQLSGCHPCCALPCAQMAVPAKDAALATAALEATTVGAFLRARRSAPRVAGAPAPKEVRSCAQNARRLSARVALAC